MFKYVRYTPVADEYTTHIFNEMSDKCKLHRFSIPYVSIECENEDDFSELMQSQESKISTEEITKEMFAEAVLHSEQVLRMYDVANYIYVDMMKPITSIYTQEERDTWMSQFNESKLFKETGDEAEAPMVVSLANVDGVTADEYATLILEKKVEFDQYSAYCLGIKREKLTSLKAEVGL